MGAAEAGTESGQRERGGNGLSLESQSPLRVIDLRESSLDAHTLNAAMPRAEQNPASVAAAVQDIVDAVRGRGFEAMQEYAQRFDEVSLDTLRVPAEPLERALAELDPQLRAALTESITRLRAFSAAQVPADVALEVAPGARLEQRWLPIERVGLYVPGGLAVYPSSVVMNVVPAQEAGVRSIAVASPPQKEYDGLPHPLILATAALVGVEEVYAMGGAQAIAAFAYGIQDEEPARSVEPVTMITGPGNVFVATAKRLVNGKVGIDAVAGATEIAVVADQSANAKLVAADLLSQAEHDPNAGAVLITPSLELAAAVQREVSEQGKSQPNRARIALALAGSQSAVILVKTLEDAFEVANAYGAEHLEIHTADPRQDARRVRSAGAVFVGENTPVSLGDYAAGSNHVLPTSGTAAFSSGLNTLTFMRGVQFIEYSHEALENIGDHVENLAEAEGLPAHGHAVAVRRHHAQEI